MDQIWSNVCIYSEIQKYIRFHSIVWLRIFFSLRYAQKKNGNHIYLSPREKKIHQIQTYCCHRRHVMFGFYNMWLIIIIISILYIYFWFVFWKRGSTESDGESREKIAYICRSSNPFDDVTFIKWKISNQIRIEAQGFINSMKYKWRWKIHEQHSNKFTRICMQTDDTSFASQLILFQFYVPYM